MTREEAIIKYRTHESDTGSPTVQAALIAFEIQKLKDHLIKHPKDIKTSHRLNKLTKAAFTLFRGRKITLFNIDNLKKDMGIPLPRKK